MKKFAEVCITPASGGFGEYECNLGDHGELYDDASDLVSQMAENAGAEQIYELGVHELPTYIRDIRGAIRNEPSRVFAIEYSADHIVYVGIAALEPKPAQ